MEESYRPCVQLRYLRTVTEWLLTNDYFAKKVHYIIQTVSSSVCVLTDFCHRVFYRNLLLNLISLLYVIKVCV